MNKFLISCIVVFSCFISCKKSNENEVTIKKFKELTITTKTLQNSFKNLEEKPVNLNDYKGKTIVLNFWETSCKPCVKEMPSFELSEKILEKDDFIFLLASNETIKNIKSFKENTKFNLNFIQYTGTLSSLKINTLPTTFVFNEKGNKVAKIMGAKNWDTPEMISKLKAYKNK